MHSIMIIMSMLPSVILLIITPLALTCATSFSLLNSPHSCVFNVAYFDNNCDAFQLTNCTWKRFQSIESSSINWRQCTQSCCNPNVDYPMSVGGIQQCQEFINMQVKPVIIIIVISVSILYCLIIVITILCRNEQRSAKCKQCCQKALKFITCGRCGNISDYEEPQRAITRLQEQQNDHPDITWKELTDTKAELLEECSICLESKPSLQLQCGHTFHRICIIKCIKMKRRCVLCRSTKFNNIIVYCQCCLQSYYQTTLVENSGWLKDNKQLCIKCADSRQNFL